MSQTTIDLLETTDRLQLFEIVRVNSPLIDIEGGKVEGIGILVFAHRLKVLFSSKTKRKQKIFTVCFLVPVIGC